MKPLAVLLVASLVANAAFVGLAVTRSPVASPAPHAAPAAPVATASSDVLRAALASGDVAALEAAGLSPAQARELALGRTVARLTAQLRAAQGQPADDGRWWLKKHSAAAHDAQLAARRALGAALGVDLGAGGETAQFAFLPPQKRDALGKILQDYEEMFAKFSSNGLQLPSDREKLRLLRAERERDIAALLSPDEKLAYDLRTSQSAANLRSRYGEAIASESEFQQLYALQKAFDEKFPRDGLVGRISPETLRARAEAERQLETDIRAAVGDDRYAALRRSADADIRNLDNLATRLGLPTTTTDTVLALRETLAAESQRINADTSLPFPERRTQIQALAERAKTDLTRTLGAEAATAYAQASPWVSMLTGGTAYSTEPTASPLGRIALGQQSIFPVPPAGVSANSAGTRQVFVSGAPAFDVAIPVERAAGGNVQVMTITTSDTVTHTPATPSATTTTTPATPAAPKK